MKYQVDQSGKIEDTAKDTVIAYSNGNEYSVRIPKKVKRQVQEIFRKNGMTRLYVYVLFALGIYFSIKKFNSKKDFIIDIEYPSKDKLIAKLLQNFLEANSKPIHYVRFSRIGNRPKVHYAAHDVLVKKREANHVLSLKEILQELKKTDGRLRECLATLVGAQPRSYKYKLSQKTKKVNAHIENV